VFQDVLSYRHERDLVLLEGLHETGEVEQGAAQAIDLVNDDAVDLAGGDGSQQALQRWPVEVSAGAAAIVEVFGQAYPAFGALAGDVGLGRLALGIQGVKLLVQTFFSRLARVDGTADHDDRHECRAGLGFFHREPPWLRRKKRKPL
jgi:hypothetical protein